MLLLCLESKDQLQGWAALLYATQSTPPSAAVKPHKTTEGEDSVDNQAECLAQSDKHDHVMLPVCGNVNIAGKEGVGGNGGARK